MRIPAQRITVDYQAVQDKVMEVCESGELTHGKYIKRFEEEFARYRGKSHCVTTNSCTSALEIAIRALRIPRGSKILIPANTYGATLQACWNAGYEVELVDVKQDLNMDIDKITWTDDIGLVIPVFIGGNVPGRFRDLMIEAYDRGIPVLSDSAHAHGVRESVNYSEVSCFSFFATKLMTTFGEGGCLVTDDADIAEYARRYRHHGRESDGMHWEHVGGGANMCMTEVQAICGLDQLKKLDDYITNREMIAKVYNTKFEPVFDNGNWYKYIVRGRPKVNSCDITLPSNVYPKPLHEHPFWPISYHKSPFPIAEEVCRGHFCLPIYNDMTVDEAQFVVDNVEVKE